MFRLPLMPGDGHALEYYVTSSYPGNNLFIIEWNTDSNINPEPIFRGNVIKRNIA
jgi:hypothetical protein